MEMEEPDRCCGAGGVIVDGIIVGAQSIGKVEDMGVLLPLLRKGYSLDKLKKMIENREFLLLSPWYY